MPTPSGSWPGGGMTSAVCAGSSRARDRPWCPQTCWVRSARCAPRSAPKGCGPISSSAGRPPRSPGWGAAGPDAGRAPRADVREPVREQRAATLVVVAVDASGSMGAERRMEAAKGAVLGLLLDAYQRRDRVALVAFRGEGADVVLRPTG